MLSAGTHLGPYEILSSLGAGGMGEVYRARDPRLGRDVAIKVLPAEFAADPERLRRFEQEARATGALNHPSVLVVLDVGAENGSPYLVSELLEGETLRRLLERRAPTTRQALSWAMQIAQGLAAAQAAGIIHRDLKPDNLFITKDGRVKILDFGLAKLRREGQEVRQPTVSDTTTAGVILGTASYMSPEQVLGLPADHRSDIFSLGIVLYEMVSRERPFWGETTAETMAAILRQDPPEFASNSAVSPAVDRVVRRCLEKNPEDRFHSAHDLGLALEAVAGGSMAVASSSMPQRRRLLRALAIGLLLAALAVGFLLGRMYPKVASADAVHFQRLTFRRGNILNARFSADGQTIVYSAAWDRAPAELFLARADGSGSRSLGLPSADILSISPTGELAILLHKPSGVNTLALVPIMGGAPREVLDNVFLAAWGPDGRELAVARFVNRVMTRIEFPIGHGLFDSDNDIVGLAVSPDGSRIAFMEEEKGRLIAVDRDGRVQTLLTGWRLDFGGLAWSGPDRIVFSGGPTWGEEAVRSITLDGGQKVLVDAAGGGFCNLHDVASDGRMLVERSVIQGGMVASVAGSPEREISWLDWSRARALSNDGKSLLFVETGEGGRGAYIRGTDGSPAVRLGDAREALDLSPDGKWALALTNDDPPQLVALPTGAGQPKRVPTMGITPHSAFFLPDGKRILIYANASRGFRIYIANLDGSERPRAITPEEIPRADCAVTPDGRFVAFNAGDGRAVLYPLEGGEPRYVPGLAPDDDPVVWSPDGRALFVYHPGEAPTHVWRFDLGTGKKTVWRELMPADPVGVKSIRALAVTPDLTSYAYSYARIVRSDLYLVKGALRPSR